MFNDSKTVSNVSTGSLSIAVDIAIPQKPIESLTPVFNTSTLSNSGMMEVPKTK